MSALTWDRTGCLQPVCTCHDETARVWDHPCSHCGCRPMPERDEDETDCTINLDEAERLVRADHDLAHIVKWARCGINERSHDFDADSATLLRHVRSLVRRTT